MKMFDAVKWMAENGHPGYANEIREIESKMDEVKEAGGKLGLFWHKCDHTLQLLACYQEQIEEVRRAAYDRWDDWRSDPLD